MINAINAFMYSDTANAIGTTIGVCMLLFVALAATADIWEKWFDENHNE